jgi:hypothetical protein
MLLYRFDFFDAGHAAGVVPEIDCRYDPPPVRLRQSGSAFPLRRYRESAPFRVAPASAKPLSVSRKTDGAPRVTAMPAKPPRKPKAPMKPERSDPRKEPAYRPEDTPEVFERMFPGPRAPKGKGDLEAGARRDRSASVAANGVEKLSNVG